MQSDLDKHFDLAGSDSLKGARPIRAFDKQKEEEAKFAEPLASVIGKMG
jgi:hypothetical protein